ncbi:uncharacterized protein LOC109949441 [Prunus persica]|uniref:uncharacterized protein LOC109949441 n=1 Tax=Prunus persica TaxID=3760 RepID=UPI0009AB3E46|nr:uncharacterized protein LOC109949441 [Prunus persica]
MAWIWNKVAGDEKKEVHRHIVVSAAQTEKIKQDFGGVENSGTLSKCPWVNRMKKLMPIKQPEKEAGVNGNNNNNSMANQIQMKASNVVQNVRQRFFPLKPWHDFNRGLLKAHPQQTYDGKKDELPWHTLDVLRSSHEFRTNASC